MSVMLHVDDRWQSGLSLFRERRRPFSDHDVAALQCVMPSLESAVRNCHLFGAARQWGAALEALLGAEAASIVLVAPPATEVGRTQGATRLIERWFAPHERRPARLPEALATFVARAIDGQFHESGRREWTRRGPEGTLSITLVRLGDGAGKAQWMLVLREAPNAVAPPPRWRATLTRREQEVEAAVARGWDNRTIAADLGCAEATVKKHMQNIFDKVGVESRTALVARTTPRG